MKYLFTFLFLILGIQLSVFACTPLQMDPSKPFTITNDITKLPFISLVTTSFGPDCENHPAPV